MEAAIEQACCQAVPLTGAQPQGAIASLTLRQSRQVLGVLEEAFSALMYHLQQVNLGSHPATKGAQLLFPEFKRPRPPPAFSGGAQRLRRPFYLCHIPMSVLLDGRGDFLSEGGSDQPAAVFDRILAQPPAG